MGCRDVLPGRMAPLLVPHPHLPPEVVLLSGVTLPLPPVLVLQRLALVVTPAGDDPVADPTRQQARRGGCGRTPVFWGCASDPRDDLESRVGSGSWDVSSGKEWVLVRPIRAARPRFQSSVMVGGPYGPRTRSVCLTTTPYPLTPPPKRGRNETFPERGRGTPRGGPLSVSCRDLRLSSSQSPARPGTVSGRNVDVDRMSIDTDASSSVTGIPGVSKFVPWSMFHQRCTWCRTSVRETPSPVSFRPRH